MSESYKKAGVDIEAGNRFIDLIRPFVARTKTSGVLGDLGGFGGFFQPNVANYKEPVLVASTDGVGTKLKLALELGRYDTIGIDLVAMCVNDIACSGALPLFFLDYFACGNLQPEKHAEIIRGIAAACEHTTCALIGGETAEMPGVYRGEEFDLAGFAVGIVDRQKIIDGSAVRVESALVGIASSGFHSNGYSLLRRLIDDQHLSLHDPFETGSLPLGEALLTPTRLYSPLVTALAKEFTLQGIAHITGGGFWDNIPRVLPKGATAVMERSAWEFPALFRFIQQKARMNDAEMLKVFNCGIGLVIVVPKEEARDLCERAGAFGEKAFVLGSIAARKEGSAPLIIEGLTS